MQERETGRFMSEIRTTRFNFFTANHTKYIIGRLVDESQWFAVEPMTCEFDDYYTIEVKDENQRLVNRLASDFWDQDEEDE